MENSIMSPTVALQHPDKQRGFESLQKKENSIICNGKHRKYSNFQKQIGQYGCVE